MVAGETDVAIAGGGPAGLVTAIRARMSGLRATVFDPARPPIDRACGEGIMPQGAAVLADIGVSVTSELGRPFFGIRYLADGTEASGRFPGAPGWGVRRTALHQALCRRAEDVGVELHWGVRVEDLTGAGFDTSEGAVTARWLVGADGRGSAVRRWAGLAGKPVRRRRFAVRRHFKIEPWTDLIEVHWADGAEAYVTPVSDGEIGVALLWAGRADRFEGLLQRFPVLAERLADAPATSSDRGSGPLENRSTSATRGNLALVGDASGSLDAISGEGLTLGFCQASAVVEAMVAGDLGRYRRAHRRIARYPAAMTRLLLLMGHKPWLRRRVMISLSRDPTLMSRFLALRMRPAGPRILGADGLLDLALAALKP